jgi:hypothetical protein
VQAAHQPWGIERQAACTRCTGSVPVVSFRVSLARVVWAELHPAVSRPVVADVPPAFARDRGAGFEAFGLKALIVRTSGVLTKQRRDG